MNATQIARELKTKREQLGHSQKDLSKAMQAAGHASWTQATVWSVESGNRNLLYVEGITLATLLPGFGINADRISQNLIRDARVLEKIRDLIETESSFDHA